MEKAITAWLLSLCNRGLVVSRVCYLHQILHSPRLREPTEAVADSPVEFNQVLFLTDLLVRLLPDILPGLVRSLEETLTRARRLPRNTEVL